MPACRANAVAPLVDEALDTPERKPLEHEEDDEERDERPDHQAGNRPDEGVAAAVLRGGLGRQDEESVPHG